MKFQSVKMRSDYCQKLLNDLKISNKLKCWHFLSYINSLSYRNQPRRVRIYQPPWQNIGKIANPVLTWWKKATWYWTILSPLILFMDMIVFLPILSIIIGRPKNKIPALPAKAGEKPMVFQLLEPNSEKDHFPAFLFFFQPEWTIWLGNTREFSGQPFSAMNEHILFALSKLYFWQTH